jgi:hypothetical protein
MRSFLRVQSNVRVMLQHTPREMTCYRFDDVVRFVLSCGLGSAYGFLQGAWPFGVVEAVWAGVAMRRWWRTPEPRK